MICFRNRNRITTKNDRRISGKMLINSDMISLYMPKITTNVLPNVDFLSIIVHICVSFI